MKKYLSILLALVLINISLIAINPQEVKADDQQQTKDVDVVIVIDNSGSMNSSTYINGTYSNTTKWEDAVDAAQQFIDKLQNGDRCAIFCFESNYNYSNGWGNNKPSMQLFKGEGFVYTITAGKNELKNNLSSLSPDFATPLFDTIGAAMDYIVDFKRSNSVGAIVALTDGMDNVNTKFYPSHDYRENKSVPEKGGDYRFGLLNCSEATFIIGLGISDYGGYRTQLENIANTSDGAYFSTANSSDLGAIYDQIAEKIDQKRDDGAEDESFLDKWLIPLIIIIIIAVVLAVILLVLLRKKKPPVYAQPPVGGYQQPPQQQPPQQQPPQQQQAPPPGMGICPTCGKPTRFIQQYNRYWCDSCQQYK